MNNIKWCFIGASRIARKVASELKESGNFNIKTVYNRTKEKGLKFAQDFNAEYFPNVEDAIKDCDFVYIALNNNLHYKYAKIALENKKNVFMEKPFTINSYEAEELINIAKANNCFIVEAMWTWFNDAAIKVKELLPRLGKIKSANMAFSFPINSISKTGRVWENSSGGGSLLDLGVYPIYYSYKLFGLPKDIKAKSKIVKDIDSYTEIVFSYDGFNSYIKSGIDRILSEDAIIRGENGYIRVPFFHKAKKVIIKVNNKKEVFKFNDLLYKKEFELVEKEYLEGKKESSYVTIEDTINIMKLLDKIRDIISLKFKDLE